MYAIYTNEIHILLVLPFTLCTLFTLLKYIFFSQTYSCSLAIPAMYMVYTTEIYYSCSLAILAMYTIHPVETHIDDRGSPGRKIVNKKIPGERIP